MFSRRLNVKDNEEDGEAETNEPFSCFPFEKVFPVYAMGFLKPDSDSDSVLSFAANVRDPIWDAAREEAKLEAEKEPILSSFLHASIMSRDCLEQALAFTLSDRLQNSTLLATQLLDTIYDVIMHDRGIHRSIRRDMQGYHALQSHRVAHVLWKNGRKVLASAVQSLTSEVFGIDIHPAAKIGEGILLDHRTGMVVGETTVVGNKVSLMHGVTLGGTGKENGGRHPKVGDGALIVACATILGNIEIGVGAMIAAGSLVLRNAPPHSMLAGTPAKVIGYMNEKDPSLTMKHST